LHSRCGMRAYAPTGAANDSGLGGPQNTKMAHRSKSSESLAFRAPAVWVPPLILVAAVVFVMTLVIWPADCRCAPAAWRRSGSNGSWQGVRGRSDSGRVHIVTARDQRWAATGRPVSLVAHDRAARDDLDFCSYEKESMRDPNGSVLGRERLWDDQEKGARADIRSAPQARSAGLPPSPYSDAQVGETAPPRCGARNLMEAR
jgi:hypothetical protein